MGAGPGFDDAQGVYQYGEDDLETLMSDLLNLGQQSVSDALVLDRARLATLEEYTGPWAEAAGVISSAANSTGNTTVIFPVGRFTVPPIVTLAAGTVSVNLALRADVSSKDSMVVQSFITASGTPSPGVVVHWTARQMTPTTAAG